MQLGLEKDHSLCSNKLFSQDLLQVTALRPLQPMCRTLNRSGRLSTSGTYTVIIKVFLDAQFTFPCKPNVAAFKPEVTSENQLVPDPVSHLLLQSMSGFSCRTSAVKSSFMYKMSIYIRNQHMICTAEVSDLYFATAQQYLCDQMSNKGLTYG